jgi:hypothetical protein
MLSNKIKEHLYQKSRTRQNPGIDQKILDWLAHDNCCHGVWKVSDIMSALMLSVGSTYAAIYRLAAAGKIGYANKTYHIFHRSSHETIRKTKASRFGTLVWDKDYYATVPIRDEWLDPVEDSESEEAEQLPLFGDDLEEMNNEELEDLIKRARHLQIQRGIKQRYSCLDDHIQEKLVHIFEKIKITDPVYFAHSDDDISLLTYTAVPNMPIDIVYDNGSGAKRLNCKHLTIFGKEIIAATDSMFGSAEE